MGPALNRVRSGAGNGTTDNMKITKKRTTFAPVTSVSLRRDGLHVVTPGRTDNRAVKRKAAPTRRKAKP